MEAVIGIKGSDYVLLASDRNAARSIVVMKNCEVKARNLGRSLAMAYSGEPGSAVEFAEFLQANVKLYAMRNDYSLTATGAAHYARRLLADALRTRSPYATNILIGGFGGLDGEGHQQQALESAASSASVKNLQAPSEPPKLFWIDHLATLTELPFAAHGYAAYFVLSLMDRHYRAGMSLDEGLALMRMCLAELKTRFVANLPQFTVKIVRASGVEDIVLSSA